MIISIVYFFVLILFFGLSFRYIFNLKLEENIFESILAILGMGLIATLFVILGLNALTSYSGYIIGFGHWWSILLLSMAIPIVKFKDTIELFKSFSFKKSVIPVLILIIMALYCSFFITGAYSYPYLEDDDPWDYAMASEFISQRYHANPEPRFTHYLEPYPIGYAFIMGLVHQLNDSILNTLKIFNVILMTLAIGFYYLMFKKMFNEKAALIITIILALIPCFMSHFIWSQTLALTLFPIGLYLLFKYIKENEGLFVPVIAFAVIFCVQTIATMKIGITLCILLLAYLICKQEKTLHIFLQILGASVLALGIFWLPALIHQGPTEFLTLGEGFSFLKTDNSTWLASYSNKAYNIQDLAFAPTSSNIDQATGLGVFPLLLAIGGILMLVVMWKTIKSEQKPIYIFVILWAIWELVSVMSGNLPIGLFAARSWAYLAITMAILSGIFIYIILNMTLNKKGIIALVGIALVSLFVFGGYFTMYVPKQAVQQATWPPGVDWTNEDELIGFITMEYNLPKDTGVFSACTHQNKVIGIDMASPYWEPEVRDFQDNLSNKSADEIYTFLQKYNYSYIVLSSSCIKKYGVEALNNSVVNFVNSGHYYPMTEAITPGFLMLRLDYTLPPANETIARLENET